MARNVGILTHTEELLAIRNQTDDFAFAKIVMVVDSKKLPNKEKAIKALRAAITEWMNKTEDGAEALYESKAGFNVGDLAICDHGQSSSLSPFLRTNGILALDVEVIEAGEQDLDFDDMLYNQQGLTEEVNREEE